MFSIFFSDKKEKWVPVDINITTKRPSGKSNRVVSKSDSKNWREDAAKGKLLNLILLIGSADSN